MSSKLRKKGRKKYEKRSSEGKRKGSKVLIQIKRLKKIIRAKYAKNNNFENISLTRNLKIVD